MKPYLRKWCRNGSASALNRCGWYRGDTDAVSFGRGTVASRSMINGGGALRKAADKVIEKGKAIAGHLMEVAPDDLEFEDGHFVVAGTDRKMPIQQIAQMSYKPIFPPELGLGLSGHGDFLLRGFTFPNGVPGCGSGDRPRHRCC